MFIVIAQFDSKSGHRRELIVELIAYGHDVRQGEPATLRFEIIQDVLNPNRFFLYEVYHDRKGFEAHTQRPQFGQRWEQLKPWLAAPVTHLCSGANIYPPDDDTTWHPGTAR